MIINPYTYAVAAGGDTTLFRVCCGGAAQSAIDAEIDWAVDTTATPSTYTNANGTNGETNSGNSVFTTGGTYTDATGYEPPSYTDIDDLWKSERYDGNASVELNYVFPVDNGDYTVNLGLCELFHTTSGSRSMSVDINSVNKLNDIDLVGRYGARYAKGWESFPITVSTSEIRIDILHATFDNPKVNCIEIIQNG